LPAPPFTRGGPVLALLGAALLAGLALLLQRQSAGRLDLA
jgi:hypothetical protein